MPHLFIFADEAGNFDFNRKRGSSRFFIVCTIACTSCAAINGDLLDLRQKLTSEGAPVRDSFHASEDKQVVRDRVFEALQRHEFSVQATIMEKSKAYPRIRQTDHGFYQ
jgi:hypothetical protein